MMFLWKFLRKYMIFGITKILIFALFLIPLITSCYIEQECFTDKNLKGSYYTLEHMKNLSRGRRNHCGGNCTDNNIELICCPYQGKVEKYRVLHQACLDAHLPFELVPLSVLSYRKQYPFMALLGWSVRHGIGPEKIFYRCSGTMIEYRYLITAAHCLKEFEDDPVVAQPGGFNLHTSHQTKDYEIDQIIVHPNYVYPNLDNDIAIIRIKDRFIGDISTVSRACISYASLEEAEPVTSIGYGDARYVGTSSPILLSTNLSIITYEECSTHYNKVTTNHICAKDQQNLREDCQGDSGGPIIMYDINHVDDKDYQPIAYLVGIQSYGDGCTNGKPGVYTRISKYYDWIEDIVFK